jgi:hypothetical protein
MGGEGGLLRAGRPFFLGVCELVGNEGGFASDDLCDAGDA